MLDSSDSEIIQRKRQRPASRKRQYRSDESNQSEAEESSNAMEGEFEPLFHEIFGNGDEYAYIYDTKDVESNEVLRPSPMEFQPSECYSYISKMLEGFRGLFHGFSYEIMRELVEGYSAEYLAFYRNRMTVRELYFVKDLIEEFKVFSSSSGKSSKADSLRSLKLFKGEERSLGIRGLLDVINYAENLMSSERKHVPREPLDLPFEAVFEANSRGWDDDAPPSLSNQSQESIRKHFRRAINQIATNPTFVDRVYRSHEAAILEDTNDALSSSLAHLQSLYQSGSGDVHDEVRKCIIQAAYESVNVDRSEIKKNFVASGMLGGEGGLQELVDLIVSLRGRPGSVAGVFYDRNLFSAVRIDKSGNVLGTAVFKDHQSVELRSFLSDTNTVCITSTSPNIRYVLQSHGLDFLYVPRRLSFFRDMKDFSIPYNIALAVQNPVLYFSRALHSLQNKYPVHNIKYTDCKMIGRAIAIACATHKLDWCSTLSHRFGHTLLNALGINLAEKYFDYDNLQALERLREVLDPVQFSNTCTYFNLLSSKHPLDKTLIHPDQYSLAVILCKGAYHRLLNDHSSAQHCPRYDLDKDQDKILELMVSHPSYVESFTVPESDEEMAGLSNVRRIFIRCNEVYFRGASDIQIFEDVVPHLDNQMYLGTICKVGADFVLCLVEDATVYAKKTFDCALNQVVQVEITGFTASMLSYSGKVLETAVQSTNRFRTHSLFRNMDEPSIEGYMNANAYSILIRPSSTENHCVVVCRVQSDLFYNLKLRECVDKETHYDFRGRRFISIDDFVEKYVKKVYQSIREAMDFKHFLRSPEEAREYLAVPGEYAKYCFYLSREYPGYIECLFGTKKILIKIEDGFLVYRNNKFSGIDELVRFIKTHATSL